MHADRKFNLIQEKFLSQKYDLKEFNKLESSEKIRCRNKKKRRQNNHGKVTADKITEPQNNKMTR